MLPSILRSSLDVPADALSAIPYGSQSSGSIP
jgi:hypothetical protein